MFRSPRFLVIGYGFENDRDMRRLECLNADRKTIEKTFSPYGKVGELIGFNKDRLLQNLADEKLLRQLLNVESGTLNNFCIIVIIDYFYIGEEVDIVMVFVLSHGVENGFILTDTRLLDGEYERFHKSEIWDRINSVGFLKCAFKFYLIGVSCKNYSLKLKLNSTP
jgi:hypothetical protein